MSFYDLCNYVETSKSADLSQKPKYILQKTYKTSLSLFIIANPRGTAVISWYDTS